MKRIWILMLMLLLVGCLKTPDRETAACKNGRQTRLTVVQPISDEILIPMDEQTLATFAQEEPAQPGTNAHAVTVLLSVKDGPAVVPHALFAPAASEAQRY